MKNYIERGQIEDFYKLLKNVYERNKNSLYKIEAILYDGKNKPVKIVFNTSKGSDAKIGKLETESLR